MGLSLEQKQAKVAEVSSQLKGAQSVIVAEYRGLNVDRVTQLRSKARKSGLYLRVLKNTLARRAVKGTPFEKLSEQMVGPLMYGISQDPVAGAKVLSEFAKENELFVIKAGAMPNTMMSAQDVKALAMLETATATLTWSGVGNVEGILVRTAPRGPSRKLYLTNRGGVPVLSRPNSSPIEPREADKPMAAASPARPPCC